LELAGVRKPLHVVRIGCAADALALVATASPLS